MVFAYRMWVSKKTVPPTPLLVNASQNCVNKAVELGEHMLLNYRGGFDSGIKDKLETYRSSKELYESLDKEKKDNK